MIVKLDTPLMRELYRIYTLRYVMPRALLAILAGLALGLACYGLSVLTGVWILPV